MSGVKSAFKNEKKYNGIFLNDILIFVNYKGSLWMGHTYNKIVVDEMLSFKIIKSFKK